MNEQISKNKPLRLAFLVPNVEFGAYWLPVMRELLRLGAETSFYTAALWPAFNPAEAGASCFRCVGKNRYLTLRASRLGYPRGVYLLSPLICLHLLRQRPHVVFAQGFSLWTVLAVALKWLMGWRIVLLWEGSTPNTDFEGSWVRTAARRLLCRFGDYCIVNSGAGRRYFERVMRVPGNNLAHKTYLVPERDAMVQHKTAASEMNGLARPLFLYVGRLIERKGIDILLDAVCTIADARWALVFIGDGALREEIEARARQQGLEDRVRVTGWKPYGELGSYFESADVLVFPSYEDTWGMVAFEALAFGLPVICSRGAGVHELIRDGENGFVVDAGDRQALAARMRWFVENQPVLAAMSAGALQSVKPFSAADVAAYLMSVALRFGPTVYRRDS